jgi:tripartite-type tricarboxylate transporter receptor subunit TctC
MAAALATTGRAAQAQAQPAYPDRPISVILPYSPGGGADLSARIVTDALGKRLGQNISIINKPGASGNIGYTAALRAPPDGYNLLWLAQTIVVNPHLFPDPGYSISDLVPIGIAAEYYQYLTVNRTSPYNSLAEFIDAARKKPDGIFYSSGGNGGAAHLSTVDLARKAGIRLTHVPYKGEGPSLAALVAGEVNASFLLYSSIAPFLADGRLRPLAVARPTRSPMLPNVPAIAETLPDSPAGGWYGFGAPRGTPDAIIEKLRTTMREVLQDPAVRGRLVAAGFEVPVIIGADFQAVIDRELKSYGVLIREADIKVD